VLALPPRELPWPRYPVKRLSLLTPSGQIVLENTDDPSTTAPVMVAPCRFALVRSAPVTIAPVSGARDVRLVPHSWHDR
jgi:hypothetical protein